MVIAMLFPINFPLVHNSFMKLMGTNVQLQGEIFQEFELHPPNYYCIIVSEGLQMIFLHANSHNKMVITLERVDKLQ
jgi:hypothetical protein